MHICLVLPFSHYIRMATLIVSEVLTDSYSGLFWASHPQNCSSYLANNRKRRHKISTASHRKQAAA